MPATGHLPDREVAAGAPAPGGPAHAATLGDREGPAISNKDEILSELWQKLGRGRPPVVVGVVRGSTPFGHAFVAYERGEPPELTVANVVWSETQEMLHFLPLSEYLFGTHHWHVENPERGAYNRDFILVPIFDRVVPDLPRMDAYFEDLQRRAREGSARFDLLTSRIRNVWSAWNPFSVTLRALGVKRWRERGNCARWTAEGLKAGRILRRNTIWPPRILVRLLSGRADVFPTRMAVVCVPRIRHARRTSHVDPDVPLRTNPLAWVRQKIWILSQNDRRFRDYNELADAVIVVRGGETRAVVGLRGEPLPAAPPAVGG